MKFGHFITSFVAVTLAGIFFISSVAAVRITAPEDVAIDVSITRDDVNYTLPKNIVIVPISPYSNDINLPSEELYRGVYFYTVGRLGFNDIPFHYLVGEDGTVFKGNQGGDERRIRVEGIGEDMILVAYMTKRNTTRFSAAAESALGQLAVELANRNSIPPDNIFVDGMHFVKNQSSRSVSIERKDVFGNWGSGQQSIRSAVRNAYSPQAKQYRVGVIGIEYSKQEATPGEVIDVSISLSNESSFGMYAGTDSALILSKTDGNESRFFVNNEWVGIAEIGLMNSDEILLPFQSATFNFKMRVPLYPGDVAETFALRTLDGKRTNTEPFQLALKVLPSSRPIIEINQTETGTLNVRGTPSSVGQEIGKVSPGQRFFVVEDAGNGWLQIELNDGRAGWVAGWLTTRIQ